MAGRPGEMNDIENGNDFYMDLEKSRTHEEMWKEFYQKRFPGYRELINTQDTKCQLQQDGVDRIVIDSDGTRISIEEKVLNDVHNEICFEWLSNSLTRKPGWIEQNLLCDYLAYAFAPTKEIYFYEWRALRKVWIEYGEYWKKSLGCKQIESKTMSRNGYSYLTYSCAVPIYIVDQCYREALIHKCIEPVNTRLLDDQEYLQIKEEIQKRKNETPEEKAKRANQRLKELKDGKI